MIAETGSRADLLAEIGADEDSDVEVRVHSVRVSGKKGFSIIAYYQDGQLLFEDESEGVWKFVYGQWYIAEPGNCTIF